MRSRSLELPNTLKTARAAVVGPLGIAVVDTFFKHQATMNAGAGMGEHLVKAVPSVFVAPEISQEITGTLDHNVDLAIASGVLAGTVVLARQTKQSVPELALVALVAQASAVAGDGLAANGGWLDKTEKVEPDVGASAVEEAILAKIGMSLMDKIKNKVARRAAKIGAVAVVTGVNVAISYLDQKNFKTDFISHEVGLSTGVLAHLVSSPGAELRDDSTSQANVTVVEYGGLARG